VYCLGNPYSGCCAIDVPDELAARLESAVKAFELVQDELGKLYHQANAAPRYP
jgi:hypothetical protein